MTRRMAGNNLFFFVFRSNPWLSPGGSQTQSSDDHSAYVQSVSHSVPPYGNVEKSRQRRSRHFAVLTYSMYAPRVKRAAALLDGPFGKTQQP